MLVVGVARFWARKLILQQIDGDYWMNDLFIRSFCGGKLNYFLQPLEQQSMDKLVLEITSYLGDSRNLEISNSSGRPKIFIFKGGVLLVGRVGTYSIPILKCNILKIFAEAHWFSFFSFSDLSWIREGTLQSVLFSFNPLQIFSFLLSAANILLSVHQSASLLGEGSFPFRKVILIAGWYPLHTMVMDKK